MSEDRGEFPGSSENREETAREAAEKAFNTAGKMGFERRIVVLDMEGNEWTYGSIVSDALTLIKFKKDGVRHPAIILRQRKTNTGELFTEFVVRAKNITGELKEVMYDSEGRIKSVEAIPSKQSDGAYELDRLPQSINVKQTERMFRGGMDQFKGELPVLVPAKRGVVIEPPGKNAEQPKPAVKKAA